MNLSELYAESSRLQKQDAATYLKNYIHLLKWKEQKEHILEFGCGNGFVTTEILYPYIEKHVEELEATDVSETMIEFAKKYNTNKRITFKTVDMSRDDDIEHAKNKFDHIFSFYCIHYILDQRALIKRLYELLNPGGQIFITVVTNSTTHESHNKIMKEETWSKYLPKTSSYANFSKEPGEFMKKILEDTGFKVDFYRADNRLEEIENFEGFITSLVKMHSFINYIPPKLHQQYIEEHLKINRNLLVYSEEQNNYKLPYESLIIVATKE